MSDLESAVDVDTSVDEGAPGARKPDARQPTILHFVRDIPNAITLVSLCCGVLGIYFAILKNFSAAMIAILWAVLFDWYDGPVAKRMSGRSAAMKLFGGRLDSLADIVSMAVFPAVVLLSYGDFGGWYLPGACWMVMAGAVRLAYFDMFGVDSDGFHHRVVIGYSPPADRPIVPVGAIPGARGLRGGALRDGPAARLSARRTVPNAKDGRRVVLRYHSVRGGTLGCAWLAALDPVAPRIS